MRTILLATVIFGLQTSTMAQSGAIESVRNWYEAYSKLDSTGLFELWALDHKDFIYAHDVEVLKSEQFIDFLNNVIKNTEQIIKADMMEGHLHDISNDAACYTTKALVKERYYPFIGPFLVFS